MNAYLLFLGPDPTPVMADSPEEAVVKLREAAKEQGVYLPVPLTVLVKGEDYEGEVTA